MFLGVRFSISGRPIINDGQANQQKHNSASRFGRKSFQTFFVAQCSCCTFELDYCTRFFRWVVFPPASLTVTHEDYYIFGSWPHPRYKAKKTPQQWSTYSKHWISLRNNSDAKETSRRFPTSQKYKKQFYPAFFATKNCSSLKKIAGAISTNPKKISVRIMSSPLTIHLFLYEAFWGELSEIQSIAPACSMPAAAK